MYCLLSAGLARGHRANPAATLKIESIYGVSVLLSGLASLVLTSKEETLISQHYKVYMERLLRLHQATPAPVVYMLAGCLPLQAQLHLRMFSIFGQVCRLKDGENVLGVRARAVFSSSSPSTKSWFWKLRMLCLQYGLPHPITMLDSPPTKLQLKSMVRAAVLQYWLKQLREKADSLPSLQYLKTPFLGLTRCHPLFWSCGSSPWETEKATSQARLLSGRYRVEALSGHWMPGNKEGMCSLPLCWKTDNGHKGTIESFLLSCPSLSTTRASLTEFIDNFLISNPDILPLVTECVMTDPVQFWLDCSTMPQVRLTVQKCGQSALYLLFKLTRHYCHILHKERMSLLSDE